MPSKSLFLIAIGLCLLGPASPAFAADDESKTPELLGTWTNTDAKTRWYRRFDLVNEDGKIFMELWATQGGEISKEPVAKVALPIDAKTLRVPPLVGVSGLQDYNFMEEKFTLKRKGDELQLTGESVFKDGTDRDRTVTERFKKKED